MKKIHLLSLALIALFSFSTRQAFAQAPVPAVSTGMSINATGAAADPSAMLDISATNKGLLIPRMAQSVIATMNNAATGLLVFQTDGTSGFYYNSSTTAGSPVWTAVTPAASAPASTTSFADFYAVMPIDNAATVAPGTDVSFPENGPISADAVIARTGPSSFNLAAIGVYQVSFQVSVNEPGQFILTLNGTDLSNTVAGRATGTSEITGVCLVQTSAINSILTVRNPAGNSTALTITPLAGGTRPSSAHLVITRLQ